MASVSAAHVSVLEVPALSQGLENSRPASKPSLDGSVLVSAIHVLVLVSELLARDGGLGLEAPGET